MNDIYSFYQLICKYQIEIPIIQRDYAQGRTDAKSADVRKSLVKKMIDAVKDDDNPLFFDFVYGRVDGNKFIPFDGQQRLTSLFLFHKYIFEKCQSVSTCNHKSNCICNDTLRRFSYATRQSSREFCEVIVEKDIIPTEEYEKKLDEQHKHHCIQCFIENQSWFYPDWKKDPTIVGMMTMLDEIHHQIRKNSNFQGFAERLTSGCNCPITFHFVDMGEHKMSDETYVKMNARGKVLTPFENFKASLEQYLEGKKDGLNLLNRWNGEYVESKEIYTGIDGIWLDLFWRVTNQGKEGAKELPDTLIMSFINRHFMNVWRCWYAKNTKSEKERKSLKDEQKNEQDEYDSFNLRIQKEMPLYPSKDDFVSFDIYQFVMDKCGTDNCLTPIFNIFDALSEPNNTIENDCQAVWNRGTSSKTKWLLFGSISETFQSRTAFFALMCYFSPEEANRQKPLLEDWMRICWNIIENYVEREESYIPALQLIDTIAQNDFDIIKLGEVYNGVAKAQVAEEITKSKKIAGDITWKSKIIEAEKYAFFKGAIRFLFQDENGKVNWDLFDIKWLNVQFYFDESGIKEEYRGNALLLRYYISEFKEWWMFLEFNYDNEPSTWKTLLTSNRYVPNHNILIELPNNEKFRAFSASLISFDQGFKNWQEQVQNDLVKTPILVEASKWHSTLNWRYNTYCLYPSNAKADKKKYVIGNQRNRILSELCDKKRIVDSEKRRFQSGDSDNFFWGWDINFKYFKEDGSSFDFQWNTGGDIVYLMVNKARQQKDDGSYYYFSARNINNSDDFVNQLDELIRKFVCQTDNNCRNGH